jgi:hypothetical protein
MRVLRINFQKLLRVNHRCSKTAPLLSQLFPHFKMPNTTPSPTVLVCDFPLFPIAFPMTIKGMKKIEHKMDQLLKVYFKTRTTANIIYCDYSG